MIHGNVPLFEKRENRLHVCHSKRKTAPMSGIFVKLVRSGNAIFVKLVEVEMKSKIRLLEDFIWI